MDPAHRGSRRVYPAALPPELCSELLLIQRSLAVVGYRPHVQSLTLYELVLACPHLLPTVAKARQLIWAAVEEQFDSPCQVWPETTSLISWTAGASIGWHHDANRPYLAARHFSAVAYLNTQGRDFEGGTFRFQSGAAPLEVQPSAGMLLLYTADDSNVHSVEQVTRGERCTLTMWFTLDPQHQEDTKVLSKLQSCLSAGLPSTMYALGSGQDIRVARLQQRLGITVVGEMWQQCQQHQASGSQQGVEASSPGSSSMPEEGGAVVVQCCTHPAAGCSASHLYDSLSDAVMTCCMLEWLGTDTPAHPESPMACKACAMLSQLSAARADLQRYLSKQGGIFDRLLPSWHQLDALVAPD